MKRLDVYLSTHAVGDLAMVAANERGRLVGTLAEAEHRLYFEYDARFLASPLWLSPFKLPPEPGLHEHRDLAFGPLFGLFDDSLPDGWGLLLMDRYFRRQGGAPETVSPLDRLAYLGARTMGALCYYPPADTEAVDGSVFDLHDLAQDAYLVLEGKSEDVLPQLMKAGGSPGGARPKVLVGVRGDCMVSGADALPAGYTGWIVKFHSRQDAVDDGRVEYAYAEMARAAGIDMPDTRLFVTSQAEAFFGVERFDREGSQRHHVHTFGNLIHANFRIPGCDYEMLMRVTRVLTKNADDVVAAFRLMVFNILAHNRDDHVKNVAFMLRPGGEWRLAPAYDLTFSHGPGGEHTMTVAGEGRRPGLAQIQAIADGADIPLRKARTIIDEVSAAVAEWQRFGRTAGIAPRRIKQIQDALSICRLA